MIHSELIGLSTIRNRFGVGQAIVMDLNPTHFMAIDLGRDNVGIRAKFIDSVDNLCYFGVKD